MRPSKLSLVLSSLALPTWLLACEPTVFEDDDAGDESSSSGGEDEASTSAESSSAGSGDPVYNCEPGRESPCPDGQKCTALTADGELVYDCVNDDGTLLAFDACEPDPSTGQDMCPAGHTCIAAEEGSEGLCLELCENDNDCDDASLCTTAPEQLVPTCAAICDPLSPLCPGQQVCQRVAQSAFVCQYPGSDDHGTTADPCDAATDRGCAQGFVCETGEIIPGCGDLACCTSLCDLAGTDPCEAPMSCGELPLDPLPGLEDIGACYVPQ
ncbi:hypothetical protein G6O69_18985 [Pseudenhygromyxa sp. WMMC2535]|uniref:hypothetical protein n=1 Tax=Pseudenhygromyxa sp. WMMC2535 TaxID=2712867 RepID=UPI001556186F|nr:hypothetical protein [Pseudenhygromyxa sp. WMMC2535]NVB39937.1 hypothetical protein [Pseudenhygromyxa sp. WMMC2535]